LLSGSSTSTAADILAGIAIPIALGTSTTRTLAAGNSVFYQVSPTALGKLTAQVDAGGAALRLSLRNGQDQVLMQSDGPSPASASSDARIQIAVDVPAGPDYLEVENLGGGNGASTFTLTTALTPVNPARTLPTHTFNIPLNPEAMVTGDFNGDGITDLVTINSYYRLNSVSVFLGNGDGTFQPPVTYDVGNYPEALATGDFNGDGRPDLAVVNTLSRDVSVLLGNGDGTFQPQVTYPVGYWPDAIVAGDFTGDGRTDLAVANYQSKSVSVLVGNGDGTFQPQVTSPAGFPPQALAIGDFTGDGRADLAIAAVDYNVVSVLLGNGDGTFQPPVAYPVGPAPVALVTGDFAGNGRIDLAVVNQNDITQAPTTYVGGTVSVLLGNGDGTFQPQVTYSVGIDPQAIVAGDFTGDGRTDLAVANASSIDVSVLLGNGDGTFQHQRTYAAGYPPSAIAAGDFNQDGRTDLALDLLGNVSVLLGNGDGSFQTGVANAVGSQPTFVVTADFNGDGRLDLATTNVNSSDVSVLLGNGDGTFGPQASYTVGAVPQGLVVGDFNGDGRTDLAVANSGSNDISVLLGNGDGTFQPPLNYATGPWPLHPVTGDFNDDGRLDLAVVNNHSDTVSVLLGNGDGTFGPQATYLVGSYPISLVTGDFNGDGRADLAVAISDKTVSVLLGKGDGTFGPPASYAVGGLPIALATGDFSGDGRLDLATANLDSTDVSVLLGRGDGTFGPQATYSVGTDPFALATGDFNGDGRDDLVVANEYDNTVSVLVSNADGTFQPQVTVAAGSEPVALAAGDFTGDGRTDLAVTSNVSSNVALLLNLNNSLVAAGPVVTTTVASPVLADLTGDGVDDSFVVDGAGRILWRRGRAQEPGTFDPPITINPGHPSRDVVALETSQGPMLASVDATDDAVSLYGWRDDRFARIGSLPTGLLPAQIATADLNGDGLDDLVVRDAGDGTLWVYLQGPDPYGPGARPEDSFEPPIHLAIGPGVSDVTLADVYGDGRADIVVTDKLTGEVGVLRNLGLGTFAPAVFYRAGGGLYSVTMTSPGDSATVTSLEATAGVAAGTLTTGGPACLVAIDPGSYTLGVLSGLGGGRLANPVTIPTSSPATAVVIADVEGHGIPDTILLSSRGVTVYRGDGKGGLLPDPFTIAAGPEPIGLTVADINHDGKPDLLVGNAYGDLLVLLGNGDGTFRPYRNADQNVALAVLPNGSSMPDFIYADQGLDQVVVDYGGGQTRVVSDSSSGLLDPGAVALADLNGDGIPDLIVANSGGNDVLVYPGLGNGQFGPELNGGKGFATGTDPVGITVATLNGRPDLIVANEGSNDVSILLNEPTAEGGFTFVPGPRLETGNGPTSTVVENVAGNTYPDLLVSDSGSNDVRLLPGVGNGFFNDQNPRIFPVGSAPNQVMVGPFTPGQGPQIATVNQGSNTVTLISDFTSDAPVFQSFSTGGIDPVSAFAVALVDGGLESLVIANAGDGRITLLGGSEEGLAVVSTLTPAALPEPSSLVLGAVSGDLLEFYATTEGVEAASLLAFVLGSGSATATSPVLSSTATGLAQLLPLNATSLALVSTLLMVSLENPAASTSTLPGTLSSESESGTTAVISFLPAPAQSSGQGFSTSGEETTVATTATVASPTTGTAVGQSLLNPGRNNLEGSSGDESSEDVNEPRGNPAPKSTFPWTRYFLGLDEAFDQIHDKIQAEDFGENGPGEREDESALDVGPGLDPLSLGSPTAPTSSEQKVDRAATRAIDEAIRSLWAEPATGPASVWGPMVLTAMIVIRSSPLVPLLRERHRQRGLGSTYSFDYDSLN
jgi:hypothetical protein